MNLFYLNAKRQPTGPVTREQLDSLVQQGALSLETMVTKEGDKAWIPYGQLDGRTATLPPPPQPTTAPTRPPTAAISRPPTSAVQRPAAVPAPVAAAAAVPAHPSAENPYVAAFSNPVDLGERLIAIGGAVGLISYLLPWVTVSGGGESGQGLSFSGWNASTGNLGIGSLLLVPAAAITAVIVAGKVHTLPNPSAVRLSRIPLAAGAAVAAIALLAAMGIQQVIGLATSFMGGMGGPKIVVSIGIGLWLTILGFAAQAVGAWMVIGKRVD